MDAEAAVALLHRLHAAQNRFYGGGDDAALREILAEDVTWHVPGDNAIAGYYAGVGAVLAYFRRRRELAGRTFRMRTRDVLTGDGEWITALTDGRAVIGGREHTWSTVGLYRVRDGRIALCRLLPFDATAFDAVWAARGPEPAGDATGHGAAAAPDRQTGSGGPAGPDDEAGPGRTPGSPGVDAAAGAAGAAGTAPVDAAGPVSVVGLRVRPRHCDAQGIMHAARYYEYFEDAFLDWLDAHAGGYAALRADGADLVIVASGCEHRRGPALDDLVSIEVRPAAAGRTSLSMSFTVRRGDDVLATGRTTYVAVSPAGAVPLPDRLRAVLRDVPAAAPRRAR